MAAGEESAGECSRHDLSDQARLAVQFPLQELQVKHTFIEMEGAKEEDVVSIGVQSAPDVLSSNVCCSLNNVSRVTPAPDAPTSSPNGVDSNSGVTEREHQKVNAL